MQVLVGHVACNRHLLLLLSGVENHVFRISRCAKIRDNAACSLTCCDGVLFCVVDFVRRIVWRKHKPGVCCRSGVADYES